jgi:WD40 repeat protein
MTARKLPPRPNLDQYKKQAKDLLKSYASGDPDVLSRVKQFHPELQKTPSAIRTEVLRLSDAQWVIAREHGFESWPKFASYIRRVAASAAKTDSSPPPLRPVFAGNLEIKDEINICVFTRDGSRALTCSQGNPVNVWDVETGRSMMSFDDRTVGAWAVKWSPDERNIFIGIRDGTVRMWDVASGVCARELKGHNGLVRCIRVFDQDHPGN